MRVSGAICGNRGSDHDTGLSIFCRVMKQSSCDSASSELPKPEKEAQPDVEPHSNTPLQEAEAKFRSGWGLEAETEPLGAESGPEAKAKSLGANPRSGSGPEATAQPLDFVVATEQDGTMCWPSETGVRRAGAQVKRG